MVDAEAPTTNDACRKGLPMAFGQNPSSQWYVESSGCWRILGGAVGCSVDGGLPAWVVACHYGGWTAGNEIGVEEEAMATTCACCC